MEKKTCHCCGHYRQHYTFDSRKIFRVYCGHCTIATRKCKRPDSAICENFISAAPVENVFASKEYLSKALLQYLLSLEILPEIHDTQDSDD